MANFKLTIGFINQIYIKPVIDHNDTNYKTTTLTWSKLKTKC